jgi:hypothetical protein
MVYKKKFRKCMYRLKILIMVTGYDIDFNFMFSDAIGVKTIKSEYNPQYPCEFHSIPLLKRNIPIFGIPVLSNLDSLNRSLIIGHNFRNDNNDYKIDIFSYCLRKKRYVILPKVTFCTLIISNYSASNLFESLPFNFNLIGKPFIKFDSGIEPKFVGLCLSKNNYNPVFLSHKINQIKIKYLNCNCKRTCFICKNKILKLSKNENNIECMMFDPYMRYFIL